MQTCKALLWQPHNLISQLSSGWVRESKCSMMVSSLHSSTRTDVQTWLCLHHLRGHWHTSWRLAPTITTTYLKPSLLPEINLHLQETYFSLLIVSRVPTLWLCKLILWLYKMTNASIHAPNKQKSSRCYRFSLLCKTASIPSLVLTAVCMCVCVCVCMTISQFVVNVPTLSFWSLAEPFISTSISQVSKQLLFL